MVGDDQIGLLRRRPSALEEAGTELGTLAAFAAAKIDREVGCDAGGQAHLLHVAGRHPGQALLHTLQVPAEAGQLPLARCQIAHPQRAQIVRAPLEQHRLERARRDLLQGGHILVPQLGHQRLVRRADHRGRARPDGRDQVGERLADAGSGLDQRMARLAQQRGDLLGHVDLPRSRSVPIAEQALDRSAGREERGHVRAGDGLRHRRLRPEAVREIRFVVERIDVCIHHVVSSHSWLRAGRVGWSRQPRLARKSGRHRE